MKIQKKYIIAGVLAIISVGIGMAYLQYRRLMDYCISVKTFSLKTLSLTNINFDLFLNFKNNSKIEFEIKSQTYNVYLNDVFVTTIKNAVPTMIKANTVSVIAVNIDFNPTSVMQTLGKNSLQLATDLSKIKIKIDMKISVSLYGIPINIPYIYESTLKELTTPSPVNDSKENKKC